MYVFKKFYFINLNLNEYIKILLSFFKIILLLLQNKK